MGSNVLDNCTGNVRNAITLSRRGINLTKTSITLNSLQNSWLLNSPLSNICPLFITSLVVFLLRMRYLPPGFPAFCELFEEGCFDSSRLSGND